jgi:hypothetical protein
MAEQHLAQPLNPETECFRPAGQQLFV